LVKEVDEVAWLLGVSFTVQVIPGQGDRLLHVLSGEIGAVHRRIRELHDAAWHWSVPGRASLVIAAIEGGSPQQNWHNVGRAVASAGALVEDGGAIAVCCELASRPGPGLKCLAAAPSRDEALAEIRRQRPEDALPAAQLAKALDRAQVYLFSRLDPSLVEELQIAPIARADELTRLARRYDSCILLANAAHAVVTMKDEELEAG
jgi:hypothetical protein